MGNKILTYIFFPCCLLILTCASTHAPQNRLPGAQETPYSSKGAWIYILTLNEEKIAGEFLAVQNDTIYVVTDDGIIGQPIKKISKAEITAFKQNHQGLGSWTILGSLLTVSNGYLGVITMPMWLIGGPLATGAQSRKPLHWYPQEDMDSLKKYARFPQGLPKHLTLSDINQLQ